jgi:hypothetical protein
MTKTYTCTYCKFQTQVKSNFKIHINSIKHQEYIREHTIKCEYCDTHVDKLELITHNLSCANKILVDKVILIKINDAVNISKVNLEAGYITKLNKLDNSHRLEINKLLKKSENALTYQNRERKKEFDSLKQQHQNEIKFVKMEADDMKQQHRTEITETKQEYKVEIDNMKLEINSLKLEIINIKQQHDKEIDKIKQQHQIEIERIKLDYKENLDCYKKDLTIANAKIVDVKDKQIETIEKSKIFVTDAKEKELMRMETVLKTCGKITEKSVDGMCSALTFANTEFTSAPVLTKMCKFDFVDDCECVDDLLHHHIENTLHIYIGNLITSLYKKDKAGDQSFWNTDASRLGYIIRQKVDTKTLWGKDVNADRITNFVIVPLVNFLIECIDDRKYAEKKFIKKNGDCPKHSKMYDRIIKKETMCKDLILAKSSLLDTKLNKNIIKYITPKFNISAQMSIVKK